MSLENDLLEEDINRIIGCLPDPRILPVIDPNGDHVSDAPLRQINFYNIINRDEHPDIFERLRGKIIVIVHETHVRIFDTLAEIKEGFEGIQTHLHLLGGPSVGGDLTLEELEGRD